MINRTVTAVLNAPRDEVFEYLSRIENLPEWATDFAQELKYEDGTAKVVNGLGEFYFRIDADVKTGVIDMYAGPSEEDPHPRCRARGFEERVLVHDVQGSRDARRAVRVAVRVAAARVRQHPRPLRDRPRELRTMIAAEERKKMLTVRLCGERVSIGVARLADLRGRDPWEVMREINLETGRPIWRAPIAVAALQNLIDAAEQEGTGPPARDGRRARADT